MTLRSTCFALAIVAVTLTIATDRPTRAADAGKPQYGTIGFDANGGDAATRPGDDFFRYANGKWIDRTEIPADRPGYSLRAMMSDSVERRVHDLLDRYSVDAGQVPTTLEGKAGAFYKSFMDEARIEKLGASPLGPQLAAIRAARTHEAIAELMAHDNDDFEGTLFNIGFDIDLKQPDVYAVYLSQAGTEMPDRDYYIQASFAEKKSAFRTHVATMLQAIHWPEAETRANEIVAFETEVAESSWANTQRRDVVATYNPQSIAELESLAPGFPWRRFLAAAGLDHTQRVIVAEKSAFPKLAAIFARTTIPTLQAWLAFTTLDNAAPYLSSALARASFDFNGKTLSGQQEQAVRWKRGVRAVSGGDYLAGGRLDRFGNIGWAVGQLYADRYFPPEAKARISTLVLNLKAAYRARIERLDWMGPGTKAMALKKLDTYTIKVGYPDHPRDYSKLMVRDDDLVGNVLRAAQYEWTFQVARLDGPVDRGDWGMTPQTNDAYNGSLRDIVFPAGILQPPIFDANADPAFNYGAAGGVIGHELTHGFDDEGRKLDAEGKLADWWSPEDAKTFEARAARLGAQYSQFEPLPGVKINGELTMGENIADLGGLTLGLEAYRASLGGKPAPVIDGMTGDQRVFLGWAQAWRGKYRDDALKRQVASDPHSPRAYRVNGVVRNIDAWYQAFDVKPGDKMYVAPEDRVRIW
jgi:putative endopeptidase